MNDDQEKTKEALRAELKELRNLSCKREGELAVANQKLEAYSQQLKRTDKSSQESERPFRDMFHNHAAVMLLIDSDSGAIFDANISAQVFYGYSHQQLCTLRIQDINQLPDDEVKEKMQNAQNQHQNSFIFPHKLKNDQIRIVEVHSTPLEINNNTVLFSIIHDVTDREQCEAKLRKNQELYLKMIANIGVVIVTVDENGINRYKSDMLEKIFGWKPFEVIGKSLFEHVHPDDRREAENFFMELLKKPYESDQIECRYLHKNGSYRWIQLTVRNLLKDPDILGFLGIYNDITDRKPAEEALKDSDWKFRALFKNGPIGVASHKMLYDEKGDPVDYRFLEVNDTFIELTGVDPRGKLVTEAFPGIENNPFDWIGVFGKVARTGETIYFEQYLESNQRWYNCFGYQYKPDHFVAVFVEITDRKLAENKLKESEERFRSLMQQSPFVVELYDLDGLQISVNKAYEELWGFPAERSLNKFNVLESNEVEKSGLLEYVKRAYAGDSVVVPEYRYDPTGNTEANGVGRVRWLNTRMYPLRDEFGKVENIVIVHQDITDRKQAETELVKLTTAVTQSPTIITITDTEGNLQYANPKFTEITGYSQEEAIGQNTNSLLRSGEQSDETFHELWDAISSRQTWRGEFHNKKKNGELYWEMATVSPIFDDQGNITNYVKVAEDITEKKKRSQKIEAIYLAAPIGIGIVKDRTIQKCNPAFLAMLGYREMDIVGRSTRLLYESDEEFQRVGEVKSALIANHGTSTMNTQFRKKNGTLVKVILSSTPLDLKDLSKGVVFTALDVTESDELKSRLQSVVDDHNLIMEFDPSILIYKDTENNILHISKAAAELMGLSRAEIEGRSSSEIHPAKADDYYKDDLEVIRSGQPKLGIIEVLPSVDGQQKWLQTSKIPVKNKSGEVEGIIVFATDITELKKKEFLLQQSEEKYRALFENVPLAYQSLDVDGCIIDINPQWLKVLGYCRDEVIGHWFGSFLERTSTELFRKSFPGFKDKGTVSGVEFKMVCKNGCSIDVSFEGCIGYDEQGAFRQTYCTFKEITAQKEAELERNKYQERLELALETGRISISEWILEDDTIHSDGRLPESLGYKDDPEYENLDMIARFKLLVHEDHHDFVKDLKGLMDCSGCRFLDRTVKYGDKDGVYYWYRTLVKVVSVDEKGKPKRIIFTVLDVDSAKRKELEAAENRERVLRADKLATLGTLTAGIAHEINNPNQMILSNTQFLESFLVKLSENLYDFPEDLLEEISMGIPIKAIPERLKRSFMNIRGGSQRITTIVSELKDYVRQGDYEFSVVDINKVIYSAQNLTSHLGKKKTDSFDWIAGKDLFVLGNFQKLEQVIVNLLVNAYESLTAKNEAVIIESMKDDDYEHVIVQIRDEGVGISDDVIERITDPFFSTKQQQGGTGMGLSVVSNILKEHEAQISFEKNFPKGTSVTIKFVFHELPHT